MYRQNFEYCVSGSAGGPGLSEARFLDLSGRLAASLAEINGGTRVDVQAILDDVTESTVAEALEPVAERYAESFDDVIVLGTGGSSLGGRTLCSLASVSTASGPGASPVQPRLHFMDNVDPAGFDALFQSVAPGRTGFLVISKSGGTLETLAQFLCCLDVFRNALGEAVAVRHFTAICEPGPRPLRDISERHGIDVLDHPSGLGGRFSAFSITGTLPAMIAGLDAEAVRQGARDVLAETAGGAAPEDIPAVAGAAINIGLALDAGVTQTVMMPYLDGLVNFGKWYRQLWAESLGKDGRGTTPIDALGTVDQHSQLQLYLEGPRDKFFTIIGAETPGRGQAIPADLVQGTDFDYLSGKRLGDLLRAEQAATADVLAENGCPVRTLSIPGLEEPALGALMMHFMLETILAADLLDVSPFGQPAVERGKILARTYLSAGINT
ncbi:MAG: glucose-6-phosphate isomerase [Rhodospirillales bacterium]|nr:glucose-6-phosphate isomerase [Rhodospirillales bacterium]